MTIDPSGPPTLSSGVGSSGPAASSGGGVVVGRANGEATCGAVCSDAQAPSTTAAARLVAIHRRLPLTAP